MVKDKLIEKLKELQKSNEKLTVKWDAGGDETLVNYFIKDKNFPYPNEMLRDLTSYLIEEFQLPNAGEYYNKGGGTISLTDDNRILLEYDEYAFFEGHESDESENFLTEFFVEDSLDIKPLLSIFSLQKISFYGSMSFHHKKSEYFETYIPRNEKNEYKTKLKQFQEQLQKEILSKLKEPPKNLEIGYSGHIAANEIVVEDIYVLKYVIDKDNKNEKKYLFE